MDEDFGLDPVALSVAFAGFASAECSIDHYQVAFGTQPGSSDVSSFSEYAVSMTGLAAGVSHILVRALIHAAHAVAGGSEFGEQGGSGSLRPV